MSPDRTESPTDGGANDPPGGSRRAAAAGDPDAARWLRGEVCILIDPEAPGGVKLVPVLSDGASR